MSAPSERPGAEHWVPSLGAGPADRCPPQRSRAEDASSGAGRPRPYSATVPLRSRISTSKSEASAAPPSHRSPAVGHVQACALWLDAELSRGAGSRGNHVPRRHRRHARSSVDRRGSARSAGGCSRRGEGGGDGASFGSAADTECRRPRLRVRNESSCPRDLPHGRRKQRAKPAENGAEPEDPGRDRPDTPGDATWICRVPKPARNVFIVRPTGKRRGRRASPPSSGEPPPPKSVP